MTKKQKLAILFGKMTAVPAIFLFTFFAGSRTVYAADEYNLYIGSMRVTSDNAANIFGQTGTDGNPTARYDAATQTLYLNGVNITADQYYEVPGGNDDPVSHYSLFAGTDVVRHLVITGENTFVSEGSEIVYVYDAKEFDADDWPVDQNGDDVITKDDLELKYVYRGDSGIYFSATGTSGENAFTITGDGKLTSASTAGTSREYDYWNEETIEGSESTQNIGTAMTVGGNGWVYIGNEDGTGPTLNLTGWNKGADFGSANRFAMQGGTIIAEAKNEIPAHYDDGVGINLPPSKACFLEGGTMAAKGTVGGPSDSPYGGAFSAAASIYADTQSSKDHGMQRVYPETVDYEENAGPGDTRKIGIRYVTGWCVVGMTADGFSENTNQVLQELSLTGGSSTDDEPDSGKELPSVDIDVQGFTKDATVFSVDVEWGAMTFRYEKSTWDSETHTTTAGRGWVVYDNKTEEVVDSAQDAINSITVTNHSNAGVYATLSYTGNDSYADIAGGFAAKADDAVTQFTGSDASAPAYLTLTSADNNGGETPGQGKETAGTVYFMPTGIGEADGAVSDISKWEKIGKITVSILTEQP